MVKIESTGIRNINFKDCLQEVAGVAPNPGALWEGLTPADWSVALGNGVAPTTFQGMGLRHLVTAGAGLYSPIYTQAPAVNSWWHTQQQQSGNRYAHQYDFMFRVNGAWPGVGAAQGIAFGYFVDHGGTPTFVESTGYRVRFDGATLFVEKFAAGVWATFVDTITSGASQALITLNADQDYYVRVTYYPTDLVYVSGNILATAGAHIISITDDFERRGSDNIFQYVCIDPAPLLGSATNHLLLAGYNTIDAEFDLITYSEGFLENPNYMHYYSQLKHSSTDLLLKWATPESGDFDLLAAGDRIEMWCKSRAITKNMVNPYQVLTDYNKLLCVHDGCVLKIKVDDQADYTTVVVADEFNFEFGGKTEHEAITQAAGGTYWDYIATIISEYQGAVAYAKRICTTPGFDQTQWGSVAVSVASWTHKGSWMYMWELLMRLVNCWTYWNPAGAFVVSQLAPIDTTKVFDFDSSTGEMQWLMGAQRSENRRTSYTNQVNQYHDNGAGVVIVTKTESVADQSTLGVSAMDKIDINMPNAEGGIASANLHAQYNDKEDIIDVYTLAYGLEFHVGCKVGVTNSAKGIDEADMTIIEVELFRVDDPEKHKVPTPNSVIRFRLAKHTDPVGTVGVLPRYENKNARYWKGRWKEGEYIEHNWT